MTTTHTPGPWARKRPIPEDATISRLVFAGDDLIAAVHDLEGAGHEAAANARLIAAAPDMLAVLQDVANYWAGGDVPAELDARMRAVIAAATATATATAANARLIAAAPDLLEALHELVAEWDTQHADQDHRTGYTLDTYGVQLARAAIATATGEA